MLGRLGKYISIEIGANAESTPSEKISVRELLGRPDASLSVLLDIAPHKLHQTQPARQAQHH
jgi:hypothetical protein